MPIDRLSVEENASLVAPFSMEEIEGVLEDCEGDKSPGPDGFNFTFVKNFWYLIKGEIRIMFDQFHGNDKLPNALLAYFVALIPKVSSPMELKDFRPISLLGCLYKILAKVLARRLARVMNSIISLNQSAFLKGRNLGDGVLVLNELVDFAKKSKLECIILKVDFEKAYDSVEWSFLVYMMERVGMSPKWIAWIKARVCGGRMSILKQGDPLAPFLFLLVVEGFSGLMRNAVRLTLFEGFKLKEEGKVYSHLHYADDTICVGKATVENLWTLKALLRGFEMASGLKINFHKSCLMGINVDPAFMEMASNFLNCSQGHLPFKYLGLPVGGNPGRVATWDPLLDQLSNKLFSWGNKHLSLGGRIVLLNSVLNAIPIFYLSFFKMPVGVVKKVVRIQREFLWGGTEGGRKISWVSWKVVCQPKEVGGLGVRDVSLVNLSLLAKWKWRLLQGDNALWRGVLEERYGQKVGEFLEGGVGMWPVNASRWWKDLVSLTKTNEVDWFYEEVVRCVGNGATTSFWKVVWRGGEAFMYKFHRLFSIAINQEATIQEMWLTDSSGGRWNFTWRRQLFVWEVISLMSYWRFWKVLCGIMRRIDGGGS